MSAAIEIASELLSKNGKPAYVEFSTMPKELKKRSEEAGRYIAVDVDIVSVRQIGATDSVIFEVDRWLKQNEVEARAQRLAPEHAAYYKRMYEAWKQGQAMPLEGTPIKGWAIIPPSQQETIIRAGIRTVEDLASMNGEAMHKIGMGAVGLKHKAQAWIAQAQDKGPITLEMAALKSKNEVLEANVATLTEQLELLREQVKRQPAMAAQPAVAQGVLTEEDLLESMTPEKPARRKARA